MNVQSNTYTFIYSTVIVLIVATLLAVAAQMLQPAQKRNVEVEKKQNILSSVRLETTTKNAEALYAKYITNSYCINSKGDKIAGDPFTIDLREQLKEPLAKRQLPVFECTKDDSLFLVIPVYGKGLWGPIWGYVSFQKEDTLNTKGPLVADYNAIYGVTFDHKGETPGLGAKIVEPKFQIPFRDKKIFDLTGKFVSVKVMKGADINSKYEVNAISGATITSKGVQAMLDTCLSAYQPYFKLKN